MFETKKKESKVNRKIYNVRDSSNNTEQKLVSVRTIYDEEFDPGSG